MLVYFVAGSVFVAFNDNRRYALYLWGMGGMLGGLVFVSWLFIHSVVFEVVLHVAFWAWALHRLRVVRMRSAAPAPTARRVPEMR
jgi:hypothetical protein